MGSNVVKLKIAVLNNANVKPVQTVLLRRVTKGDKLHPVHSQCLHTSDYRNWSYSWAQPTRCNV